jgi:serine/threonine-protein kinase
MDERRGDRFGRYEILAELGRGAMGVVYKARDPKINRVVAVKTISLAGQPAEEEQEYRERFYREAEAAGRLSHPGIVTIFDVGEEPETRAPYIVMEFVGGQPLDKLLSGGGRKLSLETALQLTHELAEALDCAHGQGVVHRDLKPANILLTEDGHAKIADFGVAKLNLANHTLAGRALGTPAYMSPEQLNGDAVDGRSDLFSLGVILYTILTGYRPFQGNSALTVSYKVVNRDPIPATVLETQLPPGLDYIISRAMAKDPAQRYQRGMEMALDIQDLLDGRELWSKAKQPSFAASVVAAVAAERDRKPGATKLGAMPKTGSPKRIAPLPNGVAEKILSHVGTRSVAGALFLVGVLLFAFRIGHALWPKPPIGKPQERSAVTPSLLTEEIATVASEPIQPVPEVKENVPSPVARERQRPAPAASAVIKLGPATKRTKKTAVAASLPPPQLNIVSTSLPLTLAPVPATLDVEVDHKFAEAKLSIWIDDRLSYTRTLEGTDKKRLVLFHHVEGHEIHAMQIPPGNHHLRVQITSGDNSSDQSVTGDFASGNERLLRVYFDKRGEMNLSLE